MSDDMDDVVAAIDRVAALDASVVETKVLRDKSVVVTIAGSSTCLLGSIVKLLRERGIVVLETALPGATELTIEYPYPATPLAAHYEKKTAPWGKKQRFSPGGAAFRQRQKKGR